MRPLRNTERVLTNAAVEEILAIERDKGAAMTIVFPADRAAWNHRVFVMVHGRGVSFRDGSLKPRNRNADDLDKYDRLLLAKGYAVVKTHRSTVENVGEIATKVEDGTTVDYVAFNDTARYIMDFADVAKAMIAARLGVPARTYFYGHSAGARIGRGLNYTPGLNADRDGKRFFDGFFFNPFAFARATVTPGQPIPSSGGRALADALGTDFGPDLDALLTRGQEPALRRALAEAARKPTSGWKTSNLSFAPPLQRPGKIWGIGLNFATTLRKISASEGIVSGANSEKHAAWTFGKIQT